jgi:hypothetical protein
MNVDDAYRDISFARWVKLGRDFDLKKFTGSFSRVADFTAWYPAGKFFEQSPEEDDARGSTQVLLHAACCWWADCLGSKKAIDEICVNTHIQEVDGRHPAAIAFEKGGPSALGFGFSAGGLLFSYYIGWWSNVNCQQHEVLLILQVVLCSAQYLTINCRVIYGLHDLGIVTRALACLKLTGIANVAVLKHMSLIVFEAYTCWREFCGAGDTKLAGASAGSLIAACYHSGLPEDLITSACFTLAKGATGCTCHMRSTDALGMQVAAQPPRPSLILSRMSMPLSPLCVQFGL